MSQQCMVNRFLISSHIILLFVFIQLTILSYCELTENKIYYIKISIFVGILLASSFLVIGAWWNILNDLFPSLVTDYNC